MVIITDIKTIKRDFEKEMKDILSELEELKKEQQTFISKWSIERLDELRKL